MEAATTLSLVVLLIAIPAPSSAQFMGPYIRTNLSLTVIIKYPEHRLTMYGLKTDLFLVGNGLGLLWNCPQKINKVGTDTWQWDFHIKATPDGHSCQDCVNNQTISLGEKFEYRVNTDGGNDMVGANFGIELPLSKMSSYFQNPPVRHVYPHFFTVEGTLETINVTSANEEIATRRWDFYLPPSFHENTYKQYPVALAFDLGASFLQSLRTHIDDMSVRYALAEEGVLIGSEDYRPLPNHTDNGQGDRYLLLTPSEGTVWFCVNGGDMWVDGCHGCIPANATGFHDKMRYMRDGCGRYEVNGGKGNEYVDYWLTQVLPAVNNATSGRLLTDRHHTAVAGCSLGGLMACHTLWTRPEHFSTGACQSSSFWWPTNATVDNEFEFLNVTLRTKTGPREPQRVYIDAGDLEQEPYFGQLNAALTAAETMVDASPQFVLDKTVTVAVIVGQTHGSYQCMSRLWMYDSKLFPAEGGPRNPGLGIDGADHSTCNGPVNFALITKSNPALYISVCLYYIMFYFLTLLV